MVSAVVVLLIVFAVAFLLSSLGWLAVACLVALLLPAPICFVVFAVGLAALLFKVLH